jgi:hypothetical protein
MRRRWLCALLATFLVVSHARAAERTASPSPAGDGAVLSPSAKSTVRGVVSAHLSAPRGEAAQRRPALHAELARSQDLLRAALRAVAEGGDEAQLALAVAERDRLRQVVEAEQPLLRWPGPDSSELGRIDAALESLGSELDAIAAMSDGPERRRRARDLGERLAGPRRDPSDPGPPMVTHPAFSAPPRSAP